MGRALSGVSPFLGDAWYRVLLGASGEEGAPVSTISDVFRLHVARWVEECLDTGVCYPVFLLGPIGVGKTTFARRVALEYAEDRGLVFVDLGRPFEARRSVPGCASAASTVSLYECIVRAVERDPDGFVVFHRLVASQLLLEDLVGVPKIDGDHLVYRVPVYMRVMSVEGVRGVLFIDEVTNIEREDVRNALFALLDERIVSVASLALSSRIALLAAGNTPRDSSSAHELPEPLVNRGSVFLVTPPLLHEWREYMDRRYDGSWWVELYGVLLARPSLFYTRPVSDENLGMVGPFATPRTWEQAAREPLCSLESLGDDASCRLQLAGKLGCRVVSEIVEAHRVLTSLGIEAEELSEYKVALKPLMDVMGEILAHGAKDSAYLNVLLDTLLYAKIVAPQLYTRAIDTIADELMALFEGVEDRERFEKLLETRFQPLYTTIMNVLTDADREAAGRLAGRLLALAEKLGREQFRSLKTILNISRP